MWKKFKAFALKGNIFDLAIGVVVGAAFSGIVNSLVTDIIAPLFAGLFSGHDIESLVLMVGESEIKYGVFISAIINFFIIAGSIFFMIQLLAKANKVLPLGKDENTEEKETLAPEPTEKELLAEILLELRKENGEEV